jgi:hypothetical protein
MTHEISLAVWDVPSPLVIGRRAALKAGVSCPYGCSLIGTAIEVRDEQGAILGSGVVGSDPWRGTMALYWVEFDVAAPHTEGIHTWSIHASAPDGEHGALESTVHVVASRPPEHRVTFEVSEQGTGIPLADVELRIGAFRATTNDVGRAQVDVPGGTLDVHAWKLGYDLLSSAASVTADTTLRLEVAVTLSPEQPYWM